MNSQQTKQAKTEKERPDSGLDNDVVKDLPVLNPEILVKILETVQEMQQTRKDRNRAMTLFRLVCKKWNEVIQNNILFYPKITDKLLNGSTNFENVKVHECILANLTMDLDSTNLALPEIRKITLCKNVTRNNFINIANRLNENCSLNTLVITEEFLESKEDLFCEETLKENFWEQVHKLVLVVPHVNLQLKQSQKVKHIEMLLECAHLPNLKELKIYGHWTLLMDILPINFMIWNSFLLDTVSLKLADLQDKNELQQIKLQGPPKYFNRDNLGFIELKSLTLEGEDMFHVARHVWAPLMDRQRHLNNLKICYYPKDKLNDFENHVHSFLPVVYVAIYNYKTITSIELVNFQFERNVDLKCFEGLIQLKSLKLDKKLNGTESNLANMTFLPESLERLTIRGLGCEYADLEEFAGARYLYKLQYLELGWIDCHHKPNQIPEGLIQAFLEKESLFKLKLTPVAVSRVWNGDGGREYFVVGEKCYLVPLLVKERAQHGGKRLPTFRITINCRDVRRMTEEEKVSGQEIGENENPELYILIDN